MYGTKQQCLMTNTFKLDKHQLFLLMLLFLSLLGQKGIPHDFEMRVVQKYSGKRSNEPMGLFEMLCSCQWANIGLQFIHNSSTNENKYSYSMPASMPLLNNHFVGPNYMKAFYMKSMSRIKGLSLFLTNHCIANSARSLLVFRPC